MHPVLFNVFGYFNIHTYGLMIALGFMIGMQLGAREARRIDLAGGDGKFDAFIADLTFWILIVALAGSRVLFMIVEWEDSYANDPLKVFRFWEGGLVFYGGLISAVLFSVWYSRRHKRSFLLVADTLIPSVALGQFFGRIGCLAAGCCWGTVTSSANPFSIQFPAGALAHSSMQRLGVIAPEAAHTIHLHPVQIYESVGTLVLFFVLLFIRTRKRFHGQVLLTYMFFYAILRSSLEFIRGDKARGEYGFLGGTISTSQIISIGFAVSAAILLVYLLRQKRNAPTLA